MNASSSSKSKGFVNKAEKEKERNQFIEKNKFEFLDNKKLKLVFDNFATTRYPHIVFNFFFLGAMSGLFCSRLL